MDINKLIKISEKIRKENLNKNLEQLLILLKYSDEIKGLLKIIDLLKNNDLKKFNSFFVNNDFTDEEDIWGEKVLETEVFFKQKNDKGVSEKINNELTKKIKNIFDEHFKVNDFNRREITPLYIDIDIDKKENIEIFMGHLQLSQKEVFKKSFDNLIKNNDHCQILKINEENVLNKINNIVKKDAFIILTSDFKGKELLEKNAKTLLAVKLYESLIFLNKIIIKENINQGKILFDIIDKNWTIELWNDENKRIPFNFNSFGYQNKIENDNLSKESLNKIQKIKKDLVLFADYYHEPYTIARTNQQKVCVFNKKDDFVEKLKLFMKESLNISDNEILDNFIIEYEKSKIKSALKNTNIEDLSIRKRM